MNARWRLLLSAFLGLGVCVAVAVPGARAASAVTSCPVAPYGVSRYAPGTGKTVALTFDDGPGLDTGRIVSILEQNKVPATFFNLGQNEQARPTYVRNEFAAGFALGDHTWDHTDLTWLSASGQASEIDRERAEAASLTGTYPCLLRPPYGNYDATTLTLAQNRHMAVWNWSVDTEDWKAAGSADSYWVNRIVSRAEAGSYLSNPVILMHNQPGGNPATVAALPQIIAFYRAHGYRFVDLLGRSGPPSITAMSVHAGPVTGGTAVTITGSNFFGVHAVTFGGIPARSWRQLATNTITAVSPPHAAGGLPVRVVSTFGTSGWVHAASFVYVNPPAITAMSVHSGSTTGGTPVTITGTAFQDVRVVTFGGVPAESWRLVAAGQIAAVSPPHAAGGLPVRVVTPYGTSGWVHAASFVYVSPPAITAMTVHSGPTTGGTPVTITGTSFTAVRGVTFGGVPATSWQLTAPGTIAAVSPPHAAGGVPVRVVTAYGTSGWVHAASWIYTS